MIFKKDFEELIEVRDSKIHGKGIFSTGFIPKGELVMIIRGDVIDEDECMRREDEEDNVYIFWNGDTYIDTNNYGKIRYINHDCEPNCDVIDRDEDTLNLVAAKNILPGEELVIDYGYEEIYEDCSCNTCLEKKAEQKAS